MNTSIPTETSGDLAKETVKLPNITLDLANSPANVMLVRQAFGGLAELIGLDRVDLNDINTTVTEACNNVVLHAYEGGSGPLEVEVFATGTNLRVVVRDHGQGLKPRSDEAEPERGIGLRLIEALADDVECRETPGGGTELRMGFATRGTRELCSPPEREGVELCAIAPGGDPAQTARIAVTPGKLAQAVLPRVLCALAVNADFSTDRISDTQLLADALLARIEGSISCQHVVNVGVNVAPRNLEIRVGPLRNGTAERLFRDSLAGPVLQRLADGAHSVVPHGQAEVLKLQLASKN